MAQLTGDLVSSFTQSTADLDVQTERERVTNVNTSTRQLLPWTAWSITHGQCMRSKGLAARHVLDLPRQPPRLWIWRLAPPGDRRKHREKVMIAE
ncbi:hypothetical protein RRG08_031465 [Elysia crispata]|uniref:Uncharacterized protein n=1 Tax=Elysia crispata TaxID=231223 RepID=A0AAE0ZP49_9GAST|nr:hypothetical protein RRG08_031465 [Elysia crispata]